MSKPKPSAGSTAGLDLTRLTQPRWVATPRLRKLGVKTSLALKHPDGSYMTRGQATDAVIEINAMIALWVDGENVDHNKWASILPADARPDAGTEGPRSIGALIDVFAGIPAPGAQAEPDPHDPKAWTLPPCDYFKDLGKDTRREYRGRLRRMLEALAGEIEGHPKTQKLPPAAKVEACARYEANMKTMRAQDIMQLLADDLPLQKDVYDPLRKQINPRTGKPQIRNANAVMEKVQSWLEWLTRYKVGGRAVIPFNPAYTVERKASPGRRNPWPADLFKRLCDQAIADGWKSVEEAAQMARELMWSQGDILALTYRQFVPGIAYDEHGNPYHVIRVNGVRSKTDVETFTTLTDRGQDLFKRIKTRWQAANGGDNIEPGPDTPLFVVDDRPGHNDRGSVGKPWSESYFQHTFIDIKKACTPPIEGYTFQDLRDTAFTEAKEAGLDDHQIQSRSQHASTESVRRLGAKHYGVTTPQISDAAARHINRVMAEKAKRKT